jgi:glutathione S-transferase
MIQPDITLYASIASRSFTVRWMLAELDLPHRVQVVDIRTGQQKAPDYLKLNPMGKVPTLTDGDAVVTETAAICLYLADRYGYGSLAPKVDAPARAGYLRWAVFSTAVLEPAYQTKTLGLSAYHYGWGNLENALSTVRSALESGPWLLGEAFTAADVTLGAALTVGLFTQQIAPEPVLSAYNDRLGARSAYQAAVAANWPPEAFQRGEPTAS